MVMQLLKIPVGLLYATHFHFRFISPGWATQFLYFSNGEACWAKPQRDLIRENVLYSSHFSPSASKREGFFHMSPVTVEPTSITKKSIRSGGDREAESRPECNAATRHAECFELTLMALSIFLQAAEFLLATWAQRTICTYYLSCFNSSSRSFATGHSVMFSLFLFNRDRSID